ncbi:ABC transporter permease subunit [Rossellomorea vietnamensis]|uniref:ABC transporter permease subunit n=1 Tax=Rossellomorea vietnamensis TaxID=218284 RepID=A0A5D4MKA3_9BACI|nr:ABC transporter permease subunit [Rossellomorea vietnamensis]TYS01421.1 ABC transporter permease subunit [Rossellomorea vietnamensis]
MERSVWKNSLFLSGFIIIVLFLTTSFIYSFLWGNEVRKLYYISVDNVLVESAPISPKWSFPFGTDPLGLDMLGKIIIGAKYTILASFAIGFLRVFIALPFAFLIGIYLQKYKRIFTGIVDSFHFIPMSILAYFLLYPILWELPQGFSTSMTERFILEGLVLIFLIVPVLSVLLGNEIARVNKEEFISSAKTLGAGRFRIIFKHILPALREKIVILFGQQIMQTLIIFIHLGLLKLFLGGTEVDYQLVNDPPQSSTNEWSGLIGDTFRYLQGAPWVPLTPILSFALVMFAVALMMEGYIRASAGYSYYGQKFKKKPETSGQSVKRDVSKADFVRVES